jgi:hypothetical protein
VAGADGFEETKKRLLRELMEDRLPGDGGGSVFALEDAAELLLSKLGIETPALPSRPSALAALVLIPPLSAISARVTSAGSGKPALPAVPLLGGSRGGTGGGGARPPSTTVALLCGIGKGEDVSVLAGGVM